MGGPSASTAQVRASRAREQGADLGQVAWVAALPCALLTIAIVALLGPPLGDAFLGPGAERFWPAIGTHPEPAEHGRYLLSLIGPALLVAVLLASVRRDRRVDRELMRSLAFAAQLVLLGFVVLCFAAQNDVLLSANRPERWEPAKYFTLPTLLVALALGPLLLATMRRQAIAARVASAVRETPARRIVLLVLAVLYTVVWLMTVVNADSSIGNTHSGVGGHLLWSMDETFAILDGRTPLVDFHAQYGQLWPHVTAVVMALIGTSIFVYTVTMASISTLALLAVYATFRRVLRSSALALVLYLPFVATGFFLKLGPLDDRYGPANLFSLWPVRYGLPYVLTWLLARHLDGAGPRRLWMLFLVAGLAFLNNPEFGSAAIAGIVVALALVRWPESWRSARRMLGEAAIGLLGALALVTLLTLVRSGSLPRLQLLSEFSRLYGVGGWAMLPMPTIGMYLVVYVTFAAAIAVAAVRALRRDADVVMTALLAWSGVFGLIAGGYYAGRSHPQVLIDLFSPWGFSLALLLVVAVRALAARGWRRPAPAELALLFGFGLLVCSLPQTPLPWSQVARLQDDTPIAVFQQHDVAQFIRRTADREQRVGILIPLGHRVAYDIGKTNVAPYASIEAMPTEQQLQKAIDQIRDEGARRIYTVSSLTPQEEFDALVAAGFSPRETITTAQATDVTELEDQQPRR